MAKSKRVKAVDFSFESALNELEKMVADMESQTLSLEDALKQFEKGTALIKACQQALAKAEQTVQYIQTSGGDDRV